MSSTLPEIITGDFAPRSAGPPKTIRVVDWNIDRGVHLDGILGFLRRAEADLLLIQEVDIDTRRSGRRNVPEEIARALKMNYIWACEFQELVEGRSSEPAYTGQLTLARWPLKNPRIVHYRTQSHFWQPHWFVPKVWPFQVRLGGRIGLTADMEGGRRSLVSYNVHLESRGPHHIRMQQMQETLNDAARYPARTPVLIAGDLNMNASHRDVTQLMHSYEFRGVAGAKARPTIDHKLGFLPEFPIDWAYVRGPIDTGKLDVHSNVRASDHFPLTFPLTFQT